MVFFGRAEGGYHGVTYGWERRKPRALREEAGEQQGDGISVPCIAWAGTQNKKQ